MFVNGESKGLTDTKYDSREATAEGVATATTDGKITFKFEKHKGMVVLSGLAVGLSFAAGHDSR